MAFSKEGPIQAVLRSYADEVVRRAKSNLKIQQKIGKRTGNRYATGTLYDSLVAKASFYSGGMLIRFGTNSEVTEKYAKVIEFGRRPGAKMPPVDAIFRWMQIRKVRLRDYSNPDPMKRGKFIPYSDAAARSAAFNIARSIGKKGIIGIKYFSDAILETFDDYGQEIADAYAREIIFVLDLDKKINGTNSTGNT